MDSKNDNDRPNPGADEESISTDEGSSTASTIDDYIAGKKSASKSKNKRNGENVAKQSTAKKRKRCGEKTEASTSQELRRSNRSKVHLKPFQIEHSSSTATATVSSYAEYGGTAKAKYFKTTNGVQKMQLEMHWDPSLVDATVVDMHGSYLFTIMFIHSNTSS